ncbi:RAB6-interacting golgin [Salarias fasciatus]|uniref:RAB6-interacting golgin n=1 Tax=Salarias fasciatus TaxID=181472 RepID=A0A672HPS3_SALFA|nr:RAB6-interacting golgin [Salarias fasciatus]
MRGGVNMSGWAGFSDEELRRMQRKGAEQRPAESGSCPAPGPRKAASSAPRSRQQLQRERALQQAAQRSRAAGEEALQAGQQLSEPPPERTSPGAPEQTAGPGAPSPRPEVKQSPAAESEESREEAPEVKELDRQEAEEVLRTRLQVLQQQQSLMEEQNRVKKDLLTRTLQLKSQQTQAEAAMLKTVRAELQQLETMATNDISILRGRIEEADWEYSKARKRYERAEAEFVSSKLDLHRKAELKEHLAEHLYAIIQQKELRKARKLEELMLRLALREEEREAGPAVETQLEAENVETVKEADFEKEAGTEEGAGSKKEAESPEL